MFTNYYLIISLLLTFCFSFTVKGDEKLDSYLGDPVFDKKRLFSDQRYPNVVVSKKGTVIAVWGNSGVAIRRSEDGGKSWGEPINVSEKGYNGGGGYC